MPRIRFTTAPKLPRDLAHLGYTQGTEADLSDDQAGRWLRRGVAVLVPAPTPTTTPSPGPSPAADAPANAAPVAIPDDWQTLHRMARMALARKLTADPVETLAAADALIAAELARRAAPVQMAV